MKIASRMRIPNAPIKTLLTGCFVHFINGEVGKAKAIVNELRRIRQEDVDNGLDDYLGQMFAHFPAMFALEMRQWKVAMALQPPAGAEPYSQSITYWARAIGAGHLHDVPAARDAVSQYHAMIEATQKTKSSYRAYFMESDGDEARAWLAFAEGKSDEALMLLRSVADEQDAVGKGEVELPAREMLADMLLELGRPEESLVHYEKSIMIDPNRSNGLYGAGRAAELGHQAQKASLYYSQLLKNCAGADSYRPELARARAVLAEK